jgi:hypothetical protein
VLYGASVVCTVEKAVGLGVDVVVDATVVDSGSVGFVVIGVVEVIAVLVEDVNCVVVSGMLVAVVDATVDAVPGRLVVIAASVVVVGRVIEVDGEDSEVDAAVVAVECGLVGLVDANGVVVVSNIVDDDSCFDVVVATEAVVDSTADVVSD